MVEYSLSQDILDKKSLIMKALLTTVRSKLVVGRVPDREGKIHRYLIELVVSGVGGLINLSFGFAKGVFRKRGDKWVFDIEVGVEGIADPKAIREHLDNLLKSDVYLSLPSPRKGHYRVKKIMKVLGKLIDAHLEGRPEIVFIARMLPKKPIFEAKYEMKVVIGIPNEGLRKILKIDTERVEFSFPVNEIPDNDSDFQKFKEFVEALYHWVYPIKVSSSRGLYTTVWRGKQVYYKKTSSNQSAVIQQLVRFRDGRFSRFELKLLEELSKVDRFDYDTKIELLKKILGPEWEQFLEQLISSLDSYVQFQSSRSFPRYLLEKEGVLGHEEKGIIYAE